MPSPEQYLKKLWNRNMIIKSILKKLVQNAETLEGQYCFLCGEKTQLNTNSEGEFFICTVDSSHQSPRAYIFDNKSPWSLENNELIHSTVGAIISKTVQEGPFFLLFLRRKYPFLYTLPAGHVECGESLEENIAREVIEETGLQISSMQPLWSEEVFQIYDPCRRGADIHRWHLFEIRTEGQPTLSDEGRIIGWYSKEEVQDMIANKALTIPSALFLQRYLGCVDNGGHD